MQPVIVVHGGAGSGKPEGAEARNQGCGRAAAVGLDVLRRGGSSLDAVEQAVRALEDDPLFNAGTGGALTSAGTLELDASIMEGTTLRAGAVAALPPFKNPVSIARAALDDSRHVMYAGDGAARFALSRGFEASKPEAMITAEALADLNLWRQGNAPPAGGGTVGAVACDAEGRVAAATSTGGLDGKTPGRVGDSPIIGGGTYADDLTGACSCTGQGERIMRVTLARSACQLLASGLLAQQAAEAAIALLGERVQGYGGLILVTPRGDIGIAFNTVRMSHAVAR